MGVGPFRSSSASYPSSNPVTQFVERVVEKIVYKPDPRNPDPAKYRIGAVQRIGEYLIVWITYPNCTNFEGNKILMYKDISLADLKKQKYIDPHFMEDKKYHSPIARFVPNDEGWEMAITLAETMRT